MHKTDVIIVGAGPVGLFCAFQAGMLGMTAHVVDALEGVGGQCVSLYPEKPIYDIPGFPRVSASGLIDRLVEQSKPFGPVFHMGQVAVSVKRDVENRMCLLLSGGQKICAGAVIVAAGVGAFSHKRPPIPNIESYENKSILYSVKDPSIFANKKVVVAGGGDSAIDWTIVLADIADAVYLVHRRDNFRCAPESAKRIESLILGGKVHKVIPYQLSGVSGESGYISEVEVVDSEGGLKKIKADYLLPFFGLMADLGPLNNWGFKLEKKGIVVDPATMRTSVDGIYAAGDIAAYPGKLKLILTGFADAAVALHSAYADVFPGKTLHFEHSTNRTNMP